MARWTAADIPDQAGRVAVVTGANSGLGYITSRELARNGARVVLACRDEVRGREAVARLIAEVPAADVELRLARHGEPGQHPGVRRRQCRRHTRPSTC